MVWFKTLIPLESYYDFKEKMRRYSGRLIRPVLIQTFFGCMIFAIISVYLFFMLFLPGFIFVFIIVLVLNIVYRCLVDENPNDELYAND